MTEEYSFYGDAEEVKLPVVSWRDRESDYETLELSQIDRMGDEIKEWRELYLSTTQAAANKAAEEGELHTLLAFILLNHNRGTSGRIIISHADEEKLHAAIAADRAARPVANKAEVDLSSLFRSDWSELGMLPASEGTYVDFDHVEALLATPPATTGASTVLTDERQAEVDKWHKRACDEREKNVLLETQVRMYEAEVAAQAGQVAVPEWQPIETAPQTGCTLLLGCFNELGNWRTMRGQWFTKNEIDQDWEETDGFEAGWYETAVEPDYPNCWSITPTYWMPLPVAPSPAKESK